MDKKQMDEALTKIILQIIEEKKPCDVQDLINTVEETTSIPPQKIVDHVLELQRLKKIALRNSKASLASSDLGAYVRSKEAHWYWVNLILAAATAIVVVAVPEDAHPQAFLRYILGAIFIFWLPGYSLVRALFPVEHLLRSASRKLSSLERVALSMGMSIALATMTGLLLNFTPFGIRPTPIVLSLLALTTALSTSAIITEYRHNARRDS